MMPMVSHNLVVHVLRHSNPRSWLRKWIGLHCVPPNRRKSGHQNGTRKTREKVKKTTFLFQGYRRDLTHKSSRLNQGQTQGIDCSRKFWQPTKGRAEKKTRKNTSKPSKPQRNKNTSKPEKNKRENTSKPQNKTQEKTRA